MQHAHEYAFTQEVIYRHENLSAGETLWFCQHSSFQNSCGHLWYFQKVSLNTKFIILLYTENHKFKNSVRRLVYLTSMFFFTVPLLLTLVIPQGIIIRPSLSPQQRLLILSLLPLLTALPASQMLTVFLSQTVTVNNSNKTQLGLISVLHLKQVAFISDVKEHLHAREFLCGFA